MTFFHKKSLGQHFLKDTRVAEKMAHIGHTHPTQTVVEIGPGEGVLTKALLTQGFTVIAIEKDRRLIPILEHTYAQAIADGTLTLISGDILDISIETIPKPYQVIANIPYYITGEIIRMFLETTNKPTSITLLMQKEVAERIVEKDGKKSLLSLSVAVFGTARIMQKVPKGAFVPVPKVDSAIVHITIDRPQLSDDDIPHFFVLLRAGFAHKRKKLHSNLSLVYTKPIIDEVFASLSLSTNTRAEELSIHTWIKLYHIVKKIEKDI